MILDGKKVRDQLLRELKAKVSRLKEQGCTPGLAVILVGENTASKRYVSSKSAACKELGMYSQQINLPETVTEQQLLEQIHHLNADNSIHGILVQLPLPAHIDPWTVQNAILPEKDVDAFHPLIVGTMMIGRKTDFLPCTPAGVMEILRHYNISVEGKHCVVLGRSNIVGKPMALLLLQQNATVTVCHSKTTNLSRITKTADILISAVGKAHTVTADMVKAGAVVIDVGMNRNEDGVLCGDVDFTHVSPIASAITPVPGGVGPMTIGTLMRNTVAAAEARLRS